MADHSPYQKRIIKRYYQNFDSIKYQKLCEVTTELYLADQKKAERLWKQAFEYLGQLGFPESRIVHLRTKKDVTILAGVLKELDGKG